MLPPECDILCPGRDCFHPGFDKGSFSQGRGYTSYHKVPKPCCITRMCHGCPSGPADRNKSSLRPIPNKAKFDAWLDEQYAGDVVNMQMDRKTVDKIYRKNKRLESDKKRCEAEVARKLWEYIEVMSLPNTTSTLSNDATA